MTTAPRKSSPLEKSLESVVEAGWDRKAVHVFAEPDSVLGPLARSGPLTIRGNRCGAFQNWFLGLQQLVMTIPDADVYLMLQDDIKVQTRLRQDLEHSLWLSPHTGFVSLYCGQLQQPRSVQPGFVRLVPGRTLYGALAIAFPSPVARSLVLDPLFQRHCRNCNYGIDVALSGWAQSSGLDCYFHAPSLVSHTGSMSSIFPHCRDGPERWGLATVERNS